MAQRGLDSQAAVVELLGSWAPALYSVAGCSGPLRGTFPAPFPSHGARLGRLDDGGGAGAGVPRHAGCCRSEAVWGWKKERRRKERRMVRKRS